VIDLRKVSPEEAQEILLALEETIRWCEETEKEADGEEGGVEG
jgi:hypothetical protein